ncbi:GNAT family N-acetyltransferase [Roseibium litorale]|uniref:GNAT family N-acetyltransferase n=1 Tax=Roseibium litorale TaxID=2803841 RepID=A0ABR9CKZ1_9HYPH|nr:GNAT family N-acetyltransferase [Roseibium litorale]MBD8891496.1 GNAT family N-acetyltransferase [Roseibium litorale]
MPASPFSIRNGFPEAERQRAADLFWKAFSGKLGKILSPEQKALALLRDLLDPAYAICAIGADGRLLGLAGFKTSEGGLTAGGLKHLAGIYGWPGALWRGLLLDLLERPVEKGVFLMDGIFVAAEARGQGVGTALLKAVEAEARARGQARVRLDVIDTNPRARALYERAGFEAAGVEETGIFSGLFGFSSATRMEKRLA